MGQPQPFPTLGIMRIRSVYSRFPRASIFANANVQRASACTRAAEVACSTQEE